MTDFYHDLHGSTVTLFQTLRNGDVLITHPPALEAAVLCAADERNGGDVVSARIRFGALVDDYGGSA